MFTRNGVTLRPLELSDIETMYPWHLDYELDLLSSWAPRRSYAQFEKRWESRITEPDDDCIYFGVVHENRLAGRVQLALIDRDQRRAAVGILLGDRSAWGKKVGQTALKMLYDYAFTVENLERIYAEVYAFNTRSMRTMEASGLKHEGLLRGHELHNGARQDVHFYGLLKAEFYAGYQTMFSLPRE